MSQFDVAVLLGALSASFVWSACFAYLSDDRREDVALIAAMGGLLAASAAATAAF